MPTIARVHVLLPGDEAERFSIYCSRNGFKKSTLIARLVREYLEREDTTEAPRRKSKASRKPRET
jgi:hypothetical protein